MSARSKLLDKKSSIIESFGKKTRREEHIQTTIACGKAMLNRIGFVRIINWYCQIKRECFVTHTSGY